MDFSIITPTCNAIDTIEQTFESINKQSGSFNVEWIVQDSCSSDATVNKVNQLKSDRLRINHNLKISITSEKDESLYDGINKAVARCEGQWVGILNADDQYADENVLSLVAQHFKSDSKIDFIYGDLNYFIVKNSQEKIVRRWRSGLPNKQKLKNGWMPPHPTVFVRKEVYRKYGLYRLDMGTAADYHWMLNLLLNDKVRTCYIPNVLIKMRIGGVSNKRLINRLKANRMDRKAWEICQQKPSPWFAITKPARKILQWL